MSDDSKLRAYLFTVEIDGIETARFQKCEGAWGWDLCLWGRGLVQGDVPWEQEAGKKERVGGAKRHRGERGEKMEFLPCLSLPVDRTKTGYKSWERLCSWKNRDSARRPVCRRKLGGDVMALEKSSYHKYGYQRRNWGYVQS